jgi:hypothetical protein
VPCNECAQQFRCILHSPLVIGGETNEVRHEMFRILLSWRLRGSILTSVLIRNSILVKRWQAFLWGEFVQEAANQIGVFLQLALGLLVETIFFTEFCSCFTGK